jgi:asparagine synthase (glutamine-hydrolysing)
MIPPPGANDGPDVHERYEVITSGKSDGLGGDTYYGYRSDLLAQVEAAFSRHGVPVGGDVRLHKGLFEETWPSIDDPIVAFAHIDCDWYDPVKFCLSSLHPRLRRGSIVLLDDYHAYSGCRQAADEFISEHEGSYSLQDGPNVAVVRN